MARRRSTTGTKSPKSGSNGELDDLGRKLFGRYGDRGNGAFEHFRKWLAGGVPQAYPEMLRRHLGPAHVDLVLDAFWRVLPFGTGGRRGPVGYGPNRLNPATVGMTVQGHCNYLRAKFGEKAALHVVVANDVRIFKDVNKRYTFLGANHPLFGLTSRLLAKLACEIYAGNGIRAYIAEPDNDAAVTSTPLLSFAIRRLGAAGGVNLSASHNPPDDNGIKVYDGEGSQPVPPDDQQLADCMDKVTEVRTLPFDRALEKDLVSPLPPELSGDYVAMYLKLYDNLWQPVPNVPIAYTPLCGTGLTTAGAVLRAAGFPVCVPPDQGPDGLFKVIPLGAPNPEVPEATEPARAYAEQVGAEIVLSSDPDADRVGVDVKLPDGKWCHFDGNQIASVLLYFLMLDPQGPRRRGLVILSGVTTRLLTAIATKAGSSFVVDDLLVGFKYIAEVLRQIGAQGSYGDIHCTLADFVLAAEESHGVLMTPGLRDKDAAPACLFLAALHQRLRLQGRTLFDYYLNVLHEAGAYDCVARSIMMRGAAGITKKDKMMASVRAQPPQSILGQPVTKVVDYLDEKLFGPLKSETDRLSRDALRLSSSVAEVIIRPSGTEPKVKLYCHLLPGAAAPASGEDLFRQIRARAEKLAILIYGDLLARIGVELTEAALRLPDIVDLDQKIKFDREVVPQLQRQLKDKSFGKLEDLLAWLRAQVAPMTPGTNPLPALKAPLATLCAAWESELGGAPLFAELRAWTRT